MENSLRAPDDADIEHLTIRRNDIFKYEQNLVDEFLVRLHDSEFVSGNTLFATEFDYSRGRTDIVILNNQRELVAIEAKLLKWKVALHQAYRNTCFTQYSYVLLPENVGLSALRYISEFTRRSVGLCLLSRNGIQIVIEAKQNIPLQTWLYEKAIETLQKRGANVRAD